MHSKEILEGIFGGIPEILKSFLDILKLFFLKKFRKKMIKIIKKNDKKNP